MRERPVGRCEKNNRETGAAALVSYVSKGETAEDGKERKTGVGPVLRVIHA